MRTRKCQKKYKGCGQTKPLDQFAPYRARKKDGTPSSGFRHICLDCYRKYHRERWHNVTRHQPETMARHQMAKLQRIARNKAWLAAYFKQRQCVDCGERDLRVLEFDHRDPSDKFRGVSELLLKGHALKTLQAEIEKCDVICANCHRKRTATQQAWWVLDHV